MNYHLHDVEVFGDWCLDDNDWLLYTSQSNMFEMPDDTCSRVPIWMTKLSLDLYATVRTKIMFAVE